MPTYIFVYNIYSVIINENIQQFTVLFIVNFVLNIMTYFNDELHCGGNDPIKIIVNPRDFSPTKVSVNMLLNIQIGVLCPESFEELNDFVFHATVSML